MEGIKPNFVNFFLASNGIFYVLASVFIIILTILVLSVFKRLGEMDKKLTALEKRFEGNMEKLEEAIEIGSTKFKETGEISKEVGKSILSYFLLKITNILEKKDKDNK